MIANTVAFQIGQASAVWGGPENHFLSLSGNRGGRSCTFLPLYPSKVAICCTPTTLAL